VKAVSLTIFYASAPRPRKNLLEKTVREKAFSVRLLSRKKTLFNKINIIKNRRKTLTNPQK
jgi:hypothetical protein